MKDKEYKKEDLGRYFCGVDLAHRMKWWQRLFVWLKIVKRSKYQDYTCSTIFKELPNGNYEIVDINQW